MSSVAPGARVRDHLMQAVASRGGWTDYGDVEAGAASSANTELRRSSIPSGSERSRNESVQKLSKLAKR